MKKIINNFLDGINTDFIIDYNRTVGDRKVDIVINPGTNNKSYYVKFVNILPPETLIWFKDIKNNINDGEFIIHVNKASNDTIRLFNDNGIFVCDCPFIECIKDLK